MEINFEMVVHFPSIPLPYLCLQLIVINSFYSHLGLCWLAASNKLFALPGMPLQNNNNNFAEAFEVNCHLANWIERVNDLLINYLQFIINVSYHSSLSIALNFFWHHHLNSPSSIQWSGWLEEVATTTISITTARRHSSSAVSGAGTLKWFFVATGWL